MEEFDLSLENVLRDTINLLWEAKDERTGVPRHHLKAQISDAHHATGEWLRQETAKQAASR